MKKSFIKIMLAMVTLFILAITNLNGHASRPCDGNHSWETAEIVQEDTCGTQGIWKLRCTTCGVTSNSYSDLYDHELVDGICIRCGLSTAESEIGPASELSNWDYQTFNSSNLIGLKKYKGKSTSVIVYPSYLINGKIYHTRLTLGTDSSPFTNNEKLTSVVFKGDKENKTKAVHFINFFSGCKNLTHVDLSGFDSSSVMLMTGMFRNCINLESLDLSTIDTSSVIEMDQLFSGCTKLESINLDGFDTSKATTFYQMFLGCTQLRSLDLSSFDTSQVTDMIYMFKNSGLSTIDLSMFDTSKVESMSCMFSNCENLVSVDLNGINTSNTKSFYEMFSNCIRLQDLYLTSFETINTTHYNSMFANCTYLKNIYVSSDKWIIQPKSTITNMFLNCATDTVTYVN